MTAIVCAGVLAFPRPVDDDVFRFQLAPLEVLNWSSEELRLRAQWLPWDETEFFPMQTLSDDTRAISEVDGFHRGVRLEPGFVGHYVAIAVVEASGAKVIFSREELRGLFAPLTDATRAAALLTLQVRPVRDPTIGTVRARTTRAARDVFWVELLMSGVHGCVVTSPRSEVYAVHEDGTFEQIAKQDVPNWRD